MPEVLRARFGNVVVLARFLQDFQDRLWLRRAANNGNHVCIDFGYSPHRFKASTIEQVAQMFLKNLEQTVETAGE